MSFGGIYGPFELYCLLNSTRIFEHQLLLYNHSTHHSPLSLFFHHLINISHHLSINYFFITSLIIQQGYLNINCAKKCFSVKFVCRL